MAGVCVRHTTSCFSITGGLCTAFSWIHRPDFYWSVNPAGDPPAGFTASWWGVDDASNKQKWKRLKENKHLQVKKWSLTHGRRRRRHQESLWWWESTVESVCCKHDHVISTEDLILAWITWRICCCCEHVCEENLPLCCACLGDKLQIKSGELGPDFICRSCPKSLRELFCSLTSRLFIHWRSSKKCQWARLHFSFHISIFSHHPCPSLL